MSHTVPLRAGVVEVTFAFPRVRTIVIVVVLAVLIGLTVTWYGAPFTPSSNGGLLISLPWWQGGFGVFGNVGPFTCTPGVC